MIKRTATLMILCLVAFFAAAQTMKVSGTVVDESGEPIIGASVKVKDTTLGVATNLEGKFTLDNVPRTARELIVSYIGMTPVTATIKPEMRIVMKSDSKQSTTLSWWLSVNRSAKRSLVRLAFLMPIKLPNDK